MVPLSPKETSFLGLKLKPSKVLIGQVLCFLHGCGCPTKIRGNVGDGFVGVLSINRHDLWEFDPDGYNIQRAFWND